MGRPTRGSISSVRDAFDRRVPRISRSIRASNPRESIAEARASNIYRRRPRASPRSRAARAPTSPPASRATRGVYSRGGGRRGRVALAAAPPSGADLEAAQLASIAGFGVIIGGFAVALGLKGEPEPCPACAQRGGEECIFCEGTGRREAPVKITKRDRADDSVLGLTRRSPLECTACKGAGMILCKTCRGTGFVTK